MTPHHQLLCDDCWRTALACLLDLHPSEVPHFYEGDHTNQSVAIPQAREWLRQRGLDLARIGMCGEKGAVLASVGATSPDLLWLLSGRHPGGFHVVICHGGTILHDPSPLGLGVQEPVDEFGTWITEFLVPASQMRRDDA